MIKWIFRISIIIFLYDRLTRSYVNPYKQILFFGLKGSGKTTLLTKYAIKAIKKGQKVYCTEDIPGTTKIDVSKLGYFTPEKNSLVLIDEIGILFNNRNFMNFGKGNDLLWWKYSRQLQLTVIAFTQIFDECDKKIRDLFDELWQVKSFLRVFSLRRRIIKKIGIQDTMNGSDIRAIYKYDNIFFGLKFTFIPRYIAFFKSFNPPSMLEIESNPYPLTDYQVMMLSTRKWLISSFRELIKKSFYKVKLFFLKLRVSKADS